MEAGYSGRERSLRRPRSPNAQTVTFRRFCGRSGSPPSGLAADRLPVPAPVIATAGPTPWPTAAAPLCPAEPAAAANLRPCLALGPRPSPAGSGRCRAPRSATELHGSQPHRPAASRTQPHPAAQAMGSISRTHQPERWELPLPAAPCSSAGRGQQAGAANAGATHCDPDHPAGAPLCSSQNGLRPEGRAKPAPADAAAEVRGNPSCRRGQATASPGCRARPEAFAADSCRNPFAAIASGLRLHGHRVGRRVGR